MSGDVPRGSVCTTNAVSALIEQLQYDLVEGPCVDAYQQDRPVLEPDLARADHAPMARLLRTGRRRRRAGRLRLPAPSRRRPARRAQPVPGPAGRAHQRSTRRRTGDGRHRRPSRARAPGERRARAARRRAGGRCRLPVRRAPGVGHGRGAARRQRRPRRSSGCGPTPSATTAPSPTSPVTWSPGRCASTSGAERRTPCPEFAHVTVSGGGTPNGASVRAAMTSAKR